MYEDVNILYNELEYYDEIHVYMFGEDGYKLVIDKSKNVDIYVSQNSLEWLQNNS